MADIYLTKQGHAKLIEELEYLKTTKRRKLSQAVGEARAHGDISENAEYDAAKEAQGLNELKITQLEEKLSRAQIIDESQMSNSEVLIGATVSLKDLDTDEHLTYTLVSEEEADYDQGKISVSSPVGKTLLGHKLGEEISIQVPAGKLRYLIEKITRE